MIEYDLLVVGGGINGAAIARDASGRGARTLLVEMGDLASGTSSKSTKLIHGGLRYLEYYEFALVRKALKEREVMIRSAPGIIHPLRFIIPHAHSVRPWWMVRAGLWLYDLLAWGGSLPRSTSVSLANGPLKPEYKRGFAYWDARCDDAGLVALNARDAQERGADIRTHARLTSARREGGRWIANIEIDTGEVETVSALKLVNAAGPWVDDVLGRLGANAGAGVRLVRGSHIVVRRLFEGDDAWLLQQPDGRVVFAIPDKGDFTLIGTTDVAIDDPTDAHPSDAEIDYLIAATNLYFTRQIGREDIVSAFAGIRALVNDGASEAEAVTRDWHLELDMSGAPLLSVFGGKITTARALAEETVDRLGIGRPWTATAKLPEPTESLERR